MNPTNSRARYQTHLEHCSMPELKKKYAENDNQWETLSNIDKQEEIKEGFPNIYAAYDKSNAKVWERFGNKSNPLLVEHCTCNLKGANNKDNKGLVEQWFKLKKSNNLSTNSDARYPYFGIRKSRLKQYEEDKKARESFTLSNVDHGTACNVALVILFVIFVLFVAYNELPKLGVTYPKRKSFSDNGI